MTPELKIIKEQFIIACAELADARYRFTIAENDDTVGMGAAEKISKAQDRMYAAEREVNRLFQEIFELKKAA